MKVERREIKKKQFLNKMKVLKVSRVRAQDIKFEEI